LGDETLNYQNKLILTDLEFRDRPARAKTNFLNNRFYEGVKSERLIVLYHWIFGEKNA
jgi:hypothetical protein